MAKNKCPFDPSKMKDAPIGMFHCPVCGHMVMAGMPHLDWDNFDEPEEEKEKCQPNNNTSKKTDSENT